MHENRADVAERFVAELVDGLARGEPLVARLSGALEEAELRAVHARPRECLVDEFRRARLCPGGICGHCALPDGPEGGRPGALREPRVEVRVLLVRDRPE